MLKSLTLSLALSLFAFAPLYAQDTQSPFHSGPVIAEYGSIADVDMTDPLPADASFKVAFDVSEAGEVGTPNRELVSVARFLNMHAANGVPVRNLKLAVVIHGGASTDLTNAQFYGKKNDGAANANADLIAKLQDHGVRVILCGQSAAGAGISRADLLPGVEMALSAITAHALLQQDGYTLNPF